LTFLTLALGGGKETTALSGASLEDIDKNPLKEFQIPLIIGAVLAMALFIFVELKVKYPLLNLRTFRQRAYSAANVVNLIIGGVLIIGLVGIALFVNTTDTSTTLVDIAFHSALALAPMTLGMALGAIGGGWLSDRLGYRWVTVGGLLMVIGGFALMYNWDIHWKPPADLLNLFPGAGLAGLGFGIVIAPVGSAVIDWAEREDIGVAAALVLIMRLIGMTIGTAAVTSWALNRYDQLKPKNIKIEELTGDMLRLPLAQVVTEMFLAAAIIAAIGLIPALLLSRRKDADSSQHEIGRIL
jgi:MFS family permease